MKSFDKISLLNSVIDFCSDSFVVAIFGLVSFLIYTVFTTFSKTKKFVIFPLALQSFAFGTAILFGIKIIAIGSLNNCKLLTNEANAFIFGGFCIFLIGFYGLKRGIEKSIK